MTVNEMIERLQETADAGFGEIEVRLANPDLREPDEDLATASVVYLVESGQLLYFVTVSHNNIKPTS